MEPWFWKLSSEWDPPPASFYDRHEVNATFRMMDRIEACRAWDGPRWTMRSCRSSNLEDFPMASVPLFSRRAAECLADLLGHDGEFVPVRLVHKKQDIAAEYLLYNCLRMLPAVDLVRLDPLDLAPDGSVKPGGFLRLTFNAVPRGTMAFRCAESPSGLLVSEAVEDRLKHSGLTGWMLRDPEAPPFRRAAIASPFRP